MNRDELEKLYNENILAHNREPYHFSKNEEADLVIWAYNPMCGDKYTIYIEHHDNYVKSAHFQGFGCAVSKASTSILMQKIEGRSFHDALQFCKDFVEAFNTEPAGPIGDPLLTILYELKHFDGRIDCIKLSWEAVTKQLTR